MSSVSPVNLSAELAEINQEEADLASNREQVSDKLKNLIESVKNGTGTTGSWREDFMLAFGARSERENVNNALDQLEEKVRAHQGELICIVDYDYNEGGPRNTGCVRGFDRDHLGVEMQIAVIQDEVRYTRQPYGITIPAGTRAHYEYGGSGIGGYLMLHENSEAIPSVKLVPGDIEVQDSQILSFIARILGIYPQLENTWRYSHSDLSDFEHLHGKRGLFAPERTRRRKTERIIAIGTEEVISRFRSEKEWASWTVLLASAAQLGYSLPDLLEIRQTAAALREDFRRKEAGQQETLDEITEEITKAQEQIREKRREGKEARIELASYSKLRELLQLDQIPEPEPIEIEKVET